MTIWFTRVAANTAHVRRVYPEHRRRAKISSKLASLEGEMARYLDMSLLDELQREGFFERIGK
jgi:hypothetical protein